MCFSPIMKLLLEKCLKKSKYFFKNFCIHVSYHSSMYTVFGGTKEFGEKYILMKQIRLWYEEHKKGFKIKNNLKEILLTNHIFKITEYDEFNEFVKYYRQQHMEFSKQQTIIKRRRRKIIQI